MIHIQSWSRTSGTINQATFTFPNTLSGTWVLKSYHIDVDQDMPFAVSGNNALRLRWNGGANAANVTLPESTRDSSGEIASAFKSIIDAAIAGANVLCIDDANTRTMSIATSVDFEIMWAASASTMSTLMNERNTANTGELSSHVVDIKNLRDPLYLSFRFSDTVRSIYNKLNISEGYVSLPFSQESYDTMPEPSITFKEPVNTFTVSIYRDDCPDSLLPYYGRWSMILERV